VISEGSLKMPEVQNSPLTLPEAIKVQRESTRGETVFIPPF